MGLLAGGVCLVCWVLDFFGARLGFRPVQSE